MDIEKKEIIEVRRSGIEGSILGFPVCTSEWGMVLHVLSIDTFSPNGYAVIRTEDIEKYRIYTEENFWFVPAARNRKIAPRPLRGMRCESLESTMESVQKRYPLMAIELELAQPDKRYVGVLEGMTDDFISIKGATPGGTWGKKCKLRKSDITRIDFGGGYETALSSVLP